MIVVDNKQWIPGALNMPKILHIQVMVVYYNYKNP